jgi:hypothetical protein
LHEIQHPKYRQNAIPHHQYDFFEKQHSHTQNNIFYEFWPLDREDKMAWDVFLSLQNAIPHHHQYDFFHPSKNLADRNLRSLEMTSVLVFLTSAFPFDADCREQHRSPLPRAMNQHRIGSLIVNQKMLYKEDLSCYIAMLLKKKQSELLHGIEINLGFLIDFSLPAMFAVEEETICLLRC